MMITVTWLHVFVTHERFPDRWYSYIWQTVHLCLSSLPANLDWCCVYQCFFNLVSFFVFASSHVSRVSNLIINLNFNGLDHVRKKKNCSSGWHASMINFFYSQQNNASVVTYLVIFSWCIYNGNWEKYMTVILFGTDGHNPNSPEPGVVVRD